ncbi:erythromycin esterase family protein [Tenacibaculum sp. XPcli2-G]|uniref:erythromycin esterase family protein n=1 Tax=Tenacibaculum sp. XPcli2-G TaxID=2954503 RepID=UPI002096A5C4|nr:erythromycin esterase family protein [Tenacibaculum sp. XPcli2-G]MCO7184273.1 erythromycin esterase family protein [Tenacibaculum sp. XPcli2-G]
MKKYFLLLITCLFNHILFSQIEGSIYKLDSLNNLLTDNIKKNIDKNIIDKKIVFLGEATHYNGSDFLAKTEFVKYLVNQHNYKNIAFESDFFALLFDHDKRNLYSMWSKSKQCKELFTFLKEKKVTIWGFDNKIYSLFSYKNFTKKLSELLKVYNIYLDEEFISISKAIIRYGYKSNDKLSKKEISYLKNQIYKILSNKEVQTNKLLIQILESFKSSIELYTVEDTNDDKLRVPIRDEQMAKNLDFLIKSHPNKKFIIWLANAHMSKCNYELMNGQTMGYQFEKLNPKKSYRIAFGSIRMPERKEKKILKAQRKNNNILSLLPSSKGNFFIDVKKLITKNPKLKDKEYDDMYIFNLYDNKIDLLNHFDALVFIGKGIEVSYPQKVL